MSSRHSGMADYGSFEEIKDDEAASPQQPVELGADGTPVRVRLPRAGEIVGLILQRFGGNRMEVRCTDGKTRNCRVPGRFKRSMWLRPRDIVLVQPWADDDSKADIIFHYHASAANQLRKKGMLNNLTNEF